MLNFVRSSQYVVAAVMVLATGVAGAGTILSTFGELGTHSASVSFVDDGAGNLIVTLTNTSDYDVMVPVDLLQGVFFTIRDGGGALVSLSTVSALLGAGSTVEHEPAMFADGLGDPGNDVGSEFAYDDTEVNGFAAQIGGDAHMGLSATGLDIFGAADRFDTSRNLQGPHAPNGMQYGISSAGDDANTGNAAVTGANALVQNQVVFTLSGLELGMAGSYTVGNVFFQYGTDINTIPQIPEPATVALLGIGIAGSLIRRRSNHV